MVDVDSIRTALRKYAEKTDLDECWHWTGAVNSSGYGSHRYIWKTVNDMNITGLHLDHFKFPESCIGKLCVNPTHLRPASVRENVLRSDGFASHEAAQTHCKHGHEFTPENTHFRSGNKIKRDCLTCRKEYDRQRYNNPERRDAMRAANRRSRAKKRGDAK